MPEYREPQLQSRAICFNRNIVVIKCNQLQSVVIKNSILTMALTCSFNVVLNVNVLFLLILYSNFALYVGCKEPKAKQVIKAMDALISDHISWNNWTQWHKLIRQFFTADIIYDSNFSPNNDFGKCVGIHEWWRREHIPYNLAFDNSNFNQVNKCYC